MDKMTRTELKALAIAAPDCFPLSSKGEIEAGLFYDAVRPQILTLLATIEAYEGALRQIAKPALGGKEQQYAARAVLEKHGE